MQGTVQVCQVNTAALRKQSPATALLVQIVLNSCVFEVAVHGLIRSTDVVDGAARQAATCAWLRRSQSRGRVWHSLMYGPDALWGGGGRQRAGRRGHLDLTELKPSFHLKKHVREKEGGECGRGKGGGRTVYGVSFRVPTSFEPCREGSVPDLTLCAGS
eukprot:44903-Rhodomonas_salina.1